MVNSIKVMSCNHIDYILHDPRIDRYAINGYRDAQRALLPPLFLPDYNGGGAAAAMTAAARRRQLLGGTDNRNKPKLHSFNMMPCYHIDYIVVYPVTTASLIPSR